MRRFAITCTLLTGLVSGLLVAASPADAAPVSRVKFVITSLTGHPIMIDRDIVVCDNNQPDRPGRCSFNEALVRTRYQRTLRIARSHMAVVDFANRAGQPFRLRVYVNGVKMQDYRARSGVEDGQRVTFAGIVFLGPGAINRI